MTGTSLSWILLLGQEQLGLEASGAGSPPLTQLRSFRDEATAGLGGSHRGSRGDSVFLAEAAAGSSLLVWFWKFPGEV